VIINVLEGGRRVGYLHTAKYEKKGVFRRVLTSSGRMNGDRAGPRARRSDCALLLPFHR
jgi:hypothetical protein